MRKSLRRLLMRLVARLETEGTQFQEGCEGVPNDDELAVMPTIELAQLLSQAKTGSPAKILLEHALNMRLAKIQAKATLSAGWAGIFGALVAAILTFILGYKFGEPSSQKTQTVGYKATAAPSYNVEKSPPNLVVPAITHSPAPPQPTLVVPTTEDASKPNKARE